MACTGTPMLMALASPRRKAVSAQASRATKGRQASSTTAHTLTLVQLAFCKSPNSQKTICCRISGLAMYWSSDCTD